MAFLHNHKDQHVAAAPSNTKHVFGFGTSGSGRVQPSILGWVQPISCLVRRDRLNPIFCLVVGTKRVETDGILTPLLGAHLSFVGPTCHPLLFLFFFLLSLIFSSFDRHLTTPPRLAALPLHGASLPPLLALLPRGAALPGLELARWRRRLPTLELSAATA